MKVALCCIGRLENQYAVEYIEYYKDLGVDKIFIYDNNHDGEEYFEDVLQKYVDEGLVDITDFRNKRMCQLEAYQDCYDRHGKEYDWICVFDFDEYLTFKRYKSIKSFLSNKKFSEYNMIHVNWMVYDDNGLVYYEDKPLVERFKNPKMPLDFKYGYNFPENNHIKSIVRGGLDDVSWKSTTHTPIGVDKCCNADGDECNANSPFSQFTFKTAWLRHYQTKTIEEWCNNKIKRGFADGDYDRFKKNSPIKEFFDRNGVSDEKLKFVREKYQYGQERVIVSMTTIPIRKDKLLANIKSLIEQSYRYDKLIINVDDNLSYEDYQWYDNLRALDSRIEINRAEAKWRSCNKLLPTLKKYPNDAIITLDDDIYYPVDSIKKLVEMHNEEPDCIIAHEINPIYLTNEKTYVTYRNEYDVMMLQKEWGKYLSNCCLFPPHVFDGTDLYDYDKMMECTKGTHDELWFWAQSTLNGVQCIGLNYVKSFAPEMLKQYTKDEYQLTTFNNTEQKINEYMGAINNMYGKRLIEQILSKPIRFKITCDNASLFIYKLRRIFDIYDYGFVINVNGLTKAWRSDINKEIDIIKERINSERKNEG